MTGVNDIDRPIDNRGNSALNALCLRRDTTVEQVRRLVEAGADLHIVNSQGMPPLGNAIQHADPAVVRYLVEAGAEMFFKTSKGTNFNALLLAIACDDRKLTDYFISAGCAIHINQSGMGIDGSDPGIHCLHVALKKGFESLVDQLLDNGALVNVEAGPENLTPFHIAVFNGSADLLTRLVKRGADLNHRQTGTGLTPLHMAAQKDRSWTLERLVKLGADPNAVDAQGRTPLHTAVINSSLHTVRELLSFKVNVNARIGQDGETPLMLAAKRNQTDMIRALLDKGADPLLTDTFNRTAFHLIPAYGGSSYAENMLRKAEETAVHKHFEEQNRKKKNGGPKRP